MVLGLENIKGLGGLKNINFESILSGVGAFVTILLLFIFVSGIIFAVLTILKKRKLFNKKIFWFEEIHGSVVPIDEDAATEMTVPGSDIRVFYIKKKDLYLPRPTIRMGKDAYWFVIKNNREIVNFKLKNINVEMKEANLDYDHTDMRYALTNLLALIKRNYRDKSQSWWREYKEVISLVILIFAMSLSFFFLIWQIGKLIDKVGALITHADTLVKSAEALRGSGIK